MKLKGIGQCLCRNVDDYKAPAADKMVMGGRRYNSVHEFTHSSFKLKFGGTSKEKEKGII